MFINCSDGLLYFHNSKQVANQIRYTFQLEVKRIFSPLVPTGILGYLLKMIMRLFFDMDVIFPRL